MLWVRKNNTVSFVLYWKVNGYALIFLHHQKLQNNYRYTYSTSRPVKFTNKKLKALSKVPKPAKLGIVVFENDEDTRTC